MAATAMYARMLCWHVHTAMHLYCTCNTRRWPCSLQHENTHSDMLDLHCASQLMRQLLSSCLSRCNGRFRLVCHDTTTEFFFFLYNCGLYRALLTADMHANVFGGSHRAKESKTSLLCCDPVLDQGKVEKVECLRRLNVTANAN